MKPTFPTQARANRWANELLYEALAKADPADLARPFGVNFGSMLGIANHTIVADRVWLGRFSGEIYDHRGFVPFTEFPALRAARREQDEAVAAFAEGLDPARLGDTLRYTSMEGVASEHPLAICLAQFYNHQTFHRGQLHALLGVLGVQAPDLDLIYYQAAHRDYSA